MEDDGGRVVMIGKGKGGDIVREGWKKDGGL